MSGAISIRYQPKIRTFVILIWGSLLFGGCFENPTLPVVTTEPVTNVTATSATVKSKIDTDGGSEIIRKGVCINQSGNPTILDGYTIDGHRSGDFETMLFVSPGFTYYVRAYAVNGAGIGYGNEVTFSVVGVSTDFVYDITGFTALGSGSVIFDRPVDSKGLCWSTSPNPTVNDFKTIEGSETGYFTSKMTNLVPGTRYYVKAYAIDGTNVFYGNETEFVTFDYVELTTKNILNAGTFIPSSGGEIIDTRGGAVFNVGICWSTTPNPTVNDAKTDDYLYYSSFNSEFSGLDPNTTYYVRAYATNIVGTSYGNEIVFTTPVSEVNDIDGNAYTSVTIGSQIWLVENLKTTRFSNGDEILQITNQVDWVNTTTAAWTYYENESKYNNHYGKLYNWLAASDSRNLCPANWHVPSQTEWDILIGYLGGETVAGSKLKETGTVHWKPDNPGATNSSGFTALPGASRSVTGYVHSLHSNGLYWSKSSSDTENAFAYSMFMYAAYANRISYLKGYGFSVRCLKD
ncbi:MAG: hypothetical protein IT213_07475 [Cytophagales bacterium]|nr:hypothetical protein [Cytophagales bacterium]